MTAKIIKTIETNNPLHRAILTTFYSMVNGAFYRVTWQRKVKTRKAFDVVIVKTVSAIVKAGIEYDNKASVIAKRENGELPNENAGLPWGAWFDYPRIIEHKGEYYLRLYPANDFGKMKISYSLDGKPATVETVKPFCLASEFAERENVDCFTLKLENLQSLERVMTTLKSITPVCPGWENTVESFLCRD